MTVNSALAGTTWSGGLFRWHDVESERAGRGLVSEYFQLPPERFELFGFDWAGRQYAVEYRRGELQSEFVLQFDPAAGAALQLAAPASVFERQIDELGEEVLNARLFRAWQVVNPTIHEVAFSECVGTNVPLFLGGQESVENLGLTDIEVYWTLVGQLFKATRDMPPGARVAGITTK